MDETRAMTVPATCSAATMMRATVARKAPMKTSPSTRRPSPAGVSGKPGRRLARTGAKMKLMASANNNRTRMLTYEALNPGSRASATPMREKMGRKPKTLRARRSCIMPG